MLQRPDGDKKWGIPDKLKESQQYPAALGAAIVKAWLQAAPFSEHRPMTPASNKVKARYTRIDADLEDTRDPWGARNACNDPWQEAPVDATAKGSTCNGPWSEAPVDATATGSDTVDPWSEIVEGTSPSESDPWGPLPKRHRAS